MNQKTSLHKDLFSRFSLKAISLFTAVVFLCSCFLSFPAQALGQTPISSNVQGGTDTSLLASASATSGKVQELVIPPELGNIDEINFGTIDQRLQTRDALSLFIFYVGVQNCKMGSIINEIIFIKILVCVTKFLIWEYYRSRP